MSTQTLTPVASDFDKFEHIGISSVEIDGGRERISRMRDTQKSGGGILVYPQV